MKITLYCPNATKPFADKIRKIIEREFGKLLPLPAEFLREQFPLFPVVSGVKRKQEVAVSVGDASILVGDNGPVPKEYVHRNRYYVLPSWHYWKQHTDNYELTEKLISLVYEAIELQAKLQVPRRRRN